MKKLFMSVAILVLLSGCASMTPRETNVAVGTLLGEIQIAINEIAAQANEESGLPPFKSAQLILSTSKGITTEGGATLILSGEGSKATADSTILTLQLVPNDEAPEAIIESEGHRIAEHVIAAVKAVDGQRDLKLQSLTMEAGLEVVQALGGGLEVELVGVEIKGGRRSESTNSHLLTLLFEQPEASE